MLLMEEHVAEKLEICVIIIKKDSAYHCFMTCVIWYHLYEYCDTALFYYLLLFILNPFIIGQPVLLPAGCMMTQNMCFQDPNSI